MDIGVSISVGELPRDVKSFVDGNLGDPVSYSVVVATGERRP